MSKDHTKDLAFLRQQMKDAERAAIEAERRVMAADSALDKYSRDRSMTPGVRGLFRRKAGR